MPFKLQLAATYGIAGGTVDKALAARHHPSRPPATRCSRRQAAIWSMILTRTPCPWPGGVPQTGRPDEVPGAVAAGTPSPAPQGPRTITDAQVAGPASDLVVRV